VDLGAVFAIVDIGLLGLGYPTVVFQDRGQLKQGISVGFVNDFVNYYQYAIFNTFKNVVGDFLSYFVSAIAAAISTSIMAAIDVATLGLGALPAAALAFIIDFAVSMIVNLVLSAVISLSFQPFYNLFWNANGGLQSDVTQLATILIPNAVALCSGSPVPTPPKTSLAIGFKSVYGSYLSVSSGGGVILDPTTLNAGDVFQAVNLGNNQYQFISGTNNKYLSFNGLSSTASVTEMFTVLQSSGTATLAANGFYLSAQQISFPTYTPLPSFGEMWTVVVPPLAKTLGLMSYWNNFLSGQPDGTVAGNHTVFNSQATWAVVSLGNNQYQFKSNSQTYLSAQSDGTIVANRVTAGPWETFTVVQGITLGMIAIKSYFGLYLSAQQIGFALQINRQTVGPWESFTIVLP